MKRFTGYIKTSLLLAALTAFLASIGWLLGGSTGLALAILFAIVINGGMYWFSDSVVLKMAQATPMDTTAHKDIYTITETMSKQMGIPVPRLYISQDPTPNAFATGRSPSKGVVCVTEGLLKYLKPHEVQAVIAHELAHIKNYDTLISTVAAVFSGAIASVIEMTFWSNLFGSGSNEEEESPLGAVGGIAMLIIAPIIATVIQMAISRSREYEADATAARLTGMPMDLASALLTIEHSIHMNPYSQEPRPAIAALSIQNPLRNEGIAQLFSTHPSTKSRVHKLHQIAEELGSTKNYKEKI